ncbi:hypothetical protein ACFX13_015478 [Malus domestica]
MYDSESNSGKRKSAGLNQRGWESSGSEKRFAADLCGAAIGSAIGVRFSKFLTCFSSLDLVTKCLDAKKVRGKIGIEEVVMLLLQSQRDVRK